MKTFRTSELNDFGRGACSQDGMQGCAPEGVTDANPFVAQPEPPSYFDLREERDELSVENVQMARQLERLEDQLKTYSTCAGRLQAELMTLRDQALSFCKLYDECPDRTKLGGEVDALSVKCLGANAVLVAYGEDPY
jgi:hypothetical protein